MQTAVTVLTAALLAGASAACAAERPIFGLNASGGIDLSRFPQWTRVMQRAPAERLIAATPCGGGAEKCRLQRWFAFLDALRDLPAEDQIDRVNRYMNQNPYVEDIANWGIGDYWETTGEFLDRRGDCEDYAIAKFYSLRELGFGSASMRIVVVRDQNLRANHAVLALFMEGRTLVLDNQIRQVVPQETIRHYRPIYSVSETGFAIYRLPPHKLGLETQH